MGRPAGTNVKELDVERAAKFGVKLWERAARGVAAEMEDWAKIKSSRNCGGKPGQHSKPGEYPKAESGKFVEGIRIVYSRDAQAIRAYSGQKYGVYLNEGTEKMYARPWADKTFRAKNWVKRIAQLARAIKKAGD